MAESRTLLVPATRIHQKGVDFYLARVAARDLAPLVEFVQRGSRDKAGGKGPRGVADRVWDALQQVPFDTGSYQREIRATKLQSLVGFFRKIENELPLIPTPIVLAAKEALDVDTRPDGSAVLHVPLTPGFFGIIDGQHRMLALKIYLDEHPESGLDVPVVIFTGLPLAHMVELFAVINSTQTRVPRSHIYDLTLERPQRLIDAPDLVDAYRVVRFLNTDEASPLQGKIRMTGTGRGGWVPQAPLIDVLMDLFQDRRTRFHVWLDTPEKKGRFFRNYFEAIRRTMPGPWRQEKKYRLKDAHALRAFLRVSRLVLDRLRESAASDRTPTADDIASLIHPWADLEVTFLHTPEDSPYYKTYFAAGSRQASRLIQNRLAEALG